MFTLMSFVVVVVVFLEVTASNIHTALIHSDAIQTQGLRETQRLQTASKPPKLLVKMTVSKAGFMYNNQL